MSEPGDGRFEEMVELMRRSAVGPVTLSTGKEWTYTPPTMSVTVPATTGLRMATRLWWDSLVALVRREPVTFEAGPEPIRGFTYESAVEAEFAAAPTPPQETQR